jgi:hypothetical protein
MTNEHILRGIWEIDDDVADELCEVGEVVEVVGKVGESAPVRRRVKLRLLLPIAAAFAAVAVAIVAVPLRLGEGGDVAEPPTTRATLPPLNFDEEIVGLPFATVCLPDGSSDGFSTASRIGTRTLAELLRPDTLAFAFVRVVRTEQVTREFTRTCGYIEEFGSCTASRNGQSSIPPCFACENPIERDDSQASTVEVISVVWSDGTELPDTFVFYQRTGGGMCGWDCCTGTFMREGGVFLLPILYSDSEWSRERNHDGWFTYGYLDVLFEVDDEGLVWSNSWSSEFDRFDGRPWQMLARAIRGVAVGDYNPGRDFASGNTWWSWDFESDRVWRRGWNSWEFVAEITYLSEEVSGSYVWDYNLGFRERFYTVRIDNILNGGEFFGFNEYNDLDLDLDGVLRRVGVGDEFTVRVVSDVSTLGQRHLTRLPLSDSQTSYSALINHDGTITSLRDSWYGDYNIFAYYEGYTVAELARLFELARTWHEVYA